MTLAEQSVDSGVPVGGNLGRRLPWERYLGAGLGLKDYWYPAFFSKELAEGETLAEEICGERIIFKRVDGEVHGVQDRCPHRGVAFSSRPECYSENTLTCWFHGFTFDVRDGKLVQIITDPGSNLIGRLSVPSFKVREAFGLVWVFIGDADIPFEHDLPPMLQRALSGEERRAFFPIARVRIACDWRLAIENGFDPGHVYGHRTADVVKQRPYPRSINGIPPGRISEFDTTPGRAAHMRMHTEQWDWVYRAEVEGNVIEVDGESGPVDDSDIVPPVGKRPPGSRLRANPGLFEQGGPHLPCLFIAATFPDGKQSHFEWYVPVDENHHNYTILASLPVDSDEAEAAFFEECTDKWGDLVWSTTPEIEGFNNYDAFGRQQVAHGYANEDFWHKELLYKPDIVLAEWRMFVSREARGIVERSGLAPRPDPEPSVIKYVH